MSLLALSDDVVLNVLEHVDVAQVAAAAASCSKLAALCSSDTLWQTLVQSRWPLMQYGAPSLVRCDGAPSSWRDVHRARVSLPRWRATWTYMDEVEHMLPLLDAELAEAQCERLVALLLGIFCTGQPVSPTDDREGRSWAWRLATTSLVSDSVLSILSTWSKTLAASLDAYYDWPSPPLSDLRAGLVRALRGASALAVLRDEVLLPVASCAVAVQVSNSAGASVGAPLRASTLVLWAEHGLEAAVSEVASAMESLEMEGFVVAVPHHLRPNVPRSHSWWHARTPIHAMGRLHMC